MTSNKEQQEDEVQVLQAIYQDQFVDLRCKDAWKIWRPPEIIITLHPANTDSSQNVNEVALDLHLKLNPDYPNRCAMETRFAQINFENATKVSDKDVESLTKSTSSFCHELKGQVMIHELCQHVQDYLREMVVREKTTDLRFKSFHEGMLTHQMQQETILRDALEKKRAAEIERHTSEWQKIELEIKKREEEKRQDILNKKQLLYNSKDDAEENFGSDSSNFVVAECKTSKQHDFVTNNDVQNATALSPKSKLLQDTVDQRHSVRCSSVPSERTSIFKRSLDDVLDYDKK